MDESNLLALKTCGRCYEDLSIAQFSPSATIADGRRRWCRSCETERRKERRVANLDAERARERTVARVRYIAHPEQFRARTRAASVANPEKNLALAKAWRKAYPDKQAAAERRWREANPDQVIAKQVKRNALKRGATFGPVDLFALWTGLCGICGDILDGSLSYPNPLSKSVDHIHPIVLGGSHEQSNLQWAHLRCNKQKGARPPEPQE